MLVRLLEPRDITGVLAIQRSSPEIAQWNAGDYSQLKGDSTAAWVVEIDHAVAGFIVAQRAADELEILNVAVAQSVRRSGAGTRLLNQALSWGAGHHATRVHLEVRASNRTAIAFYNRHGFMVSGSRPRYYASPVEDAILLSRRIEPNRN